MLSDPPSVGVVTVISDEQGRTISLHPSHTLHSRSPAREHSPTQGVRGLNEGSRARLTSQEAITASVEARAPKIETPSEAWF